MVKGWIPCFLDLSHVQACSRRILNSFAIIIISLAVVLTIKSIFCLLVAISTMIHIIGLSASLLGTIGRPNSRTQSGSTTLIFHMCT